MSSISQHTQWDSFMMFFFRKDFVVEKNNLVIGVHCVFDLVYYRNNNIELAFYISMKFVFECGDRRRGICSSDNLFLARVTEGRKEG